MNRRAGRPQGRPRGSTEQANALAEFLLSLTSGMTVRELAGRYHVGKTLWGEYRSGQKIIPLELLRQLAQDRTPDERTRQVRMETAERLHAAALEAGPATEPAPALESAPHPESAPEQESAPTAAANPGAASAGRGHPRPLMLLGGGAAIVALVVLVLLVRLITVSAEVVSASCTSGTAVAATAASFTGVGVFAAGPGGRGVYQWNGTDEKGWTRIGEGAKRLWSGPAGLFSIGMDDCLYRYEGRPGSWSLIGGPGSDFTVSGSHVYGLAVDHSAVFEWDGRGMSWTPIGTPAARLYGGAPGLFATDAQGWIFRYSGSPHHWDFVGTSGASFALTGRYLYGLTPDRSAVNRWPDGERQPWGHAAGSAGELYGGAAGLFSADLSHTRLRVLTDEPGDGRWQDIGSAGAEVQVGSEGVYVLSMDRSQILYWSRDTGWQRIGGPAQTFAVGDSER